MQSNTADRLPGSPDFETESSFPERYLEDDGAAFSGNGPDRYQPAGTKGGTETTGHAPFASQRWPSHSTPYLPYNHGHVSGALPVGDGFLAVDNQNNSRYTLMTRWSGATTPRLPSYKRQPRCKRIGPHIPNSPWRGFSGNPHTPSTLLKMIPTRSRAPAAVRATLAIRRQRCRLHRNPGDEARED